MGSNSYDTRERWKAGGLLRNFLDGAALPARPPGDTCVRVRNDADSFLRNERVFHISHPNPATRTGRAVEETAMDVISSLSYGSQRLIVDYVISDMLVASSSDEFKVISIISHEDAQRSGDSARAGRGRRFHRGPRARVARPSEQGERIFALLYVLESGDGSVAKNVTSESVGVGIVIAGGSASDFMKSNRVKRCRRTADGGRQQPPRRAGPPRGARYVVIKQYRKDRKPRSRERLREGLAARRRSSSKSRRCSCRNYDPLDSRLIAARYVLSEFRKTRRASTPPPPPSTSAAHSCI
ncbi:hypothetical protein EVAR_60184_1 [Eumeta japonica]|uniref:Uncharacterized protein n=1 Tax=Eumeta variegata TaxID=151549 RepID=A0A4C1Z773_EUMVA|nr:hypothetical protein EVAR_60184_1 [Eumeta japonica]